MIKSIAQYHKLHKVLPILAGKWSKQTDLSKLPQKVENKQTNAKRNK